MITIVQQINEYPRAPPRGTPSKEMQSYSDKRYKFKMALFQGKKAEAPPPGSPRSNGANGSDSDSDSVVSGSGGDSDQEAQSPTDEDKENEQSKPSESQKQSNVKPAESPRSNDANGANGSVSGSGDVGDDEGTVQSSSADGENEQFKPSDSLEPAESQKQPNVKPSESSRSNDANSVDDENDSDSDSVAGNIMKDYTPTQDRLYTEEQVRGMIGDAVSIGTERAVQQGQVDRRREQPYRRAQPRDRNGQLCVPNDEDDEDDENDEDDDPPRSLPSVTPTSSSSPTHHKAAVTALMCDVCGKNHISSAGRPRDELGCWNKNNPDEKIGNNKSAKAKQQFKALSNEDPEKYVPFKKQRLGL